ncbi:unnamed protein product [Lepidochelys kempii]
MAGAFPSARFWRAEAISGRSGHFRSRCPPLPCSAFLSGCAGLTSGAMAAPPLVTSGSPCSRALSGLVRPRRAGGAGPGRLRRCSWQQRDAREQGVVSRDVGAATASGCRIWHPCGPLGASRDPNSEDPPPIQEWLPPRRAPPAPSFCPSQPLSSSLWPPTCSSSSSSSHCANACWPVDSALTVPGVRRGCWGGPATAAWPASRLVTVPLPPSPAAWTPAVPDTRAGSSAPAPLSLAAAPSAIVPVPTSPPIVRASIASALRSNCSEGSPARKIGGLPHETLSDWHVLTNAGLWGSP